MLRSMKTALQRRSEDLRQRSSVSLLVREAVKDYLNTTYPEALTTCSVRYEEQEGLVVITTPSKALAGELTLNTRDIRAHLAAHNVRVTRIIAR